MTRAVALVTLGCARNDVDSEELAARLAADGWQVVAEPAEADAVLVNTCGFVESAKKDSIDTLLAAADLKGSARTQAVVAVGCLAQRYGTELAASLPEADAVLGFDDYSDIGARLTAVLAGERVAAPTPGDRRKLLPLTPVERRALIDEVSLPGHADGALHGPSTGPRTLRKRLDHGPVAPVKLASGCDRRCAFCAIPSFRGAYVSRTPEEVLADVEWLAADGVREVVLVSENSTSYGKDLGDIRLLESLLPQIAGVDGIERVRVSYLQPAEMRPGLAEVIATTPRLATYFDLSFQHASGPLLRSMRRFGDSAAFLDLLAGIRRMAPSAGVRSNFIVGFPGETDQDFATLRDFLVEARLDVIGIFGYSDEDGTEAASYDAHLDADVISARVEELSRLAEDLVSQRAEERIGEQATLLVENVAIHDGLVEGRVECQGPEVDGTTSLVTSDPLIARGEVRMGDMIAVRIVGTDGVDLIGESLSA